MFSHRDFLARLTRWFIPPGPEQLSPHQEWHKEGCIVLKEALPHFAPRKIRSNAQFYAMYCMISQEVTEANSPAAEELFVEIFNDKDSFVDLLVENIKKADDVEQEMCRGQKRLASLRDEEDVDEPVVIEDPEGVLNKKVIEVMEV